MPPTDGPPTPGAGLHANVLDALGQEIVSGTTPVGAVVRIDQLDERFGVSRSVVREAVRVLSSMGLVETRRRLGVRVRPRTQWNVFDPRVIRWRLDGPDREDQLLSLGELRRGFEPVAAELAADRATPEQCGAMVGAVMRMTVHAKSGDLEAYLQADQVFHTTMLEASGNEMLAALSNVVSEVLSGRTHHQLMPARPNPVAIRLHGDVAQAIGSGDGRAAAEAMTAIITEASEAVRRTAAAPEGTAAD
ncbi:GntR family transcriptional regulator [Phycicoccus sp. Root563]|uniref:FadR/GntR family transcriptional regulator n=1 Tax=unclassified Phycicoccus TaxID=2637926 RepID=UPI000703011E|nr:MULTISPECIES: FadR/GntR family transcriptional regulator [unclassified Phycicoccus]KQU69541.1 GntR family transcriptional regulator [Phycicoccus sp. Root101]KQZ90768.1 GntR family transcriptional regulator [Phycicoccus sp. Root563]